MNAIQLLRADGFGIQANVCGKCGTIHPDREKAERCCHCTHCGQPLDGEMFHGKCLGRASRALVDEALAVAELIPDYDGPFLWGDGVFENANEFLDYVPVEDMPEEGFIPVYRAPKLDIDTMMETLHSHMHDEWEPIMSMQLEFAIDEFNVANATNGTYYEGRKQKWSRENLLRMAKGDDDHEAA